VHNRHRSGGSTAHWVKEKERSVKVDDLGRECRHDRSDVGVLSNRAGVNMEHPRLSEKG